MSDVAQVVSTGIGVAGTLGAAVLTQWIGRRAERERRTQEDSTRWLTDRRRVAAEMLAEALRIERDLWSAAAFLPRADERPADMPYVVALPDEGIPGVVDEFGVEFLREALFTANDRLNDLENLAAEVSLVGSPEDASRARDLLESLWDVSGLLEVAAPFDDVADAVERARAARVAFTESARTSLRVGGPYTRHDARPIRDT